MMARNCQNSCGTIFRGYSVVGITTAETYPRNWAFGSAKMVSSKVKEKFCTADLVHLSKQGGLLNHSSAESQAPCGGCLVIHQKGRNTSTLGSRGVTSKVSWVYCLRCCRSRGREYCSPAPAMRSPVKLYRVIRHFCWMVEMLLFSTGLLLMSGVQHPVSSRIRMVHYDCVPQCRTILTIGRLPQSGFTVDNSGEAIGGLSFLRCLSFDDSWSSRPLPFC